MSATRRRGLGRGLDALLGEAPKPAGGQALDVPLTALRASRQQPRTQFEDEALEGLAESIRAQGIVQPLIVTPDGDQYSIVAGERRFRAAKLAGLVTVPVVVRDVESDQELLELALVENVQRSDLNPLEEAEAFRSLSEEFGLSQQEIGRRVGKGRSAIANTLRLLKLPREVKSLIWSGDLSAGQARPLLAVKDRKQQLKLAARAARERLSARRMEELSSLAGEEGAARSRPRSKEKPKDVHTRAAEEKLTRELQTRVEIVRRRKGGVVQIHFHSEDELMGLYDRLTSEER